MSGSIGDNVFRASGVIAAAAAGRTGTVDWVTTIYVTGDSPITSVSGKGYFLNTTAGTITINLPTSPSAGDIVSIKDYARTWDSNNVTVGRGGSNMDATAADTTFITAGLSVTMIYMDATKGWSLINDDTTSKMGALFVTATGGNSCATCGDYKIHTFTGPGTFCVSAAGNATGSNGVDYLVVAGGAGGGGKRGGGGGAGGLRGAATTFCNAGPSSPRTACVSIAPVTVQGYSIVVGAAGTPGTAAVPHPSDPGGVGGSGTVSTFSCITSAGGGGGSGGCNPTGASTGGSGGGAAGPCGVCHSGAAGNTPPTSPAQGMPGGNITPAFGSGGGGGALVAGALGGPGSNVAGPGGAGGGFPTAFGTSGQNCGGVYYFSGGGGGGGRDNPDGTGGTGGLGGGGAGGTGICGGTKPGFAATINTGGAGGGGGNNGTPCKGGAGGSGIVIIRYKFQ